MGFRTCAENVEDREIKGMLTERARHCAEAASELQNEVRRLGGDPDTHGSVSGILHRGWLNVKAAITSKDEAAVLAECERGEDIAVLGKPGTEERLPAWRPEERMISGRSVALGARTPWKRMRWSLGRGTSAARRCINSSGDITTWVVPSW